MKTINLKKYYYPICKKDTFVEVPDEEIGRAHV